jgi:hypothetical protein
MIERRLVSNSTAGRSALSGNAANTEEEYIVREKIRAVQVYVQDLMRNC